MDLQYLLDQSNWRLRAWLLSLDPGERAGWRKDPGNCPVANWLEAEANDHITIVIADIERISIRDWRKKRAAQSCVTPLLFEFFIDQVDAQTRACLRRELALVLLDQAERQLCGRLLPQWSTCQPCDVPGCQKYAVTPPLHGFLSAQRHGKIVREACRLFSGRLCGDHLQQLIVPPDDWWPKDEPEPMKSRALVGAGATRLEDSGGSD